MMLKFCTRSMSNVHAVCCGILLLAFSIASPALAGGQLVPFASQEGMERLSRSDVRADFPELANQFEAQYNKLFCGPTTVAIVLNALSVDSDEKPHDRSRFRPEDLHGLPGGMDPSVGRYTQDNVIEPGEKSRAEVFGAPLTVDGKNIADFGYQIRQLDEMLKANGVETELVIVNDQKPEAEIRTDLLENLQRDGDYVIVNYRRRDVGQPGGGHISPLGGYDAASDSVLVMDVNPSAQPWVWMPLKTLIRGMRTFDTIENRGYILVSRP